MEKDTVLLSVNEYNRLRDFRIEIERGNTLLIHGSQFSYGEKFISTGEALKEISRLNESLKENYQRECKRLQDLVDGKKTIEISNIKEMSIWQFIKWKNKQ